MAHPYGQAACSNTLAPPPPDTSSLIRDSLSVTENLLAEAHEAITQLEIRLDTVLTPVTPTSDSVGPATIRPLSSHLNGRVLDLNYGLSSVSNRLRDLIRRVEV